MFYLKSISDAKKSGALRQHLPPLYMTLYLLKEEKRCLTFHSETLKFLLVPEFFFVFTVFVQKHVIKP